MLPVVGVPQTVQRQMRPYRDLFRRSEGGAYGSRSITGLLVSANQTWPGIHATQVWEENKPSSRAMQAAVVEAGWDAEALLPRHRKLLAPAHRSGGREVISLEWTLGHHERGPHSYGGTKSYDYVARRVAPFQTTATAVIANRQGSDGIAAQIQVPDLGQEEEA